MDSSQNDRLSPNPKGISPLAEAVSRALRQSIEDGLYSPGTPLPSERMLAQRHSVSRTVVREAMGLLAVQGLLLQAERCRPVVALNGPRHRSSIARMGVWLWPRADDYTAAAIFRGIQRSARDQEVRLIVGTASHLSWDDDVESEARFLRGLLEEKADGAILWYLGGQRNLPLLQQARAQGVEFVFVDRLPPRGFEADFVGTENVGSARNAVAHLVHLGHRHIAFVGNLDAASPVAGRREGYRRAMEDAGLETGPFFSPKPGETDSESARRIATEIRSHSPQPTAVFTVNDSVAIALVEALREEGIAIPGDLSVVGFDGLSHWIPGSGPLTSAKQNFTSIGEMAGETLLARFASPSPSTFRHILLDAPLSLGSTTAGRMCPTTTVLKADHETRLHSY